MDLFLLVDLLAWGFMAKKLEIQAVGRPCQDGLRGGITNFLGFLSCHPGGTGDSSVILTEQQPEIPFNDGIARSGGGSAGSGSPHPVPKARDRKGTSRGGGQNARATVARAFCPRPSCAGSNAKDGYWTGFPVLPNQAAFPTTP
jgi:hypothetical protein